MIRLPALPPRHLRRACQTEVQSRFTHCMTSYFAEPVFDRAGRRILYQGFDTLTQGSVVVRDLETGTEQVWGETRNLNFHSTHLRWVCADRGVLFNSLIAEADVPAIIWLEDCGRVQRFDGLANHRIRRISEDGDRGYGSGPGDQQGTQAVRRVHFESGQVETLLTSAEVLAALPEEFPDTEVAWRFSHPVPNPDETQLFVKFQRPQPWTYDARNFPDWGAFLVVDLQRGAIHSFGSRTSGHPYWMPGGRHIVNIKMALDGSFNRHLVVMDALTGEVQHLSDLPIEGPGHPSISPDGRYLVTDAMTADKRATPIYIIDLQSGGAREIARLPHHSGTKRDPRDMAQISRAHPHPVWSPCSRRVVVNCNHEEQFMGLILLDDFIC